MFEILQREKDVSGLAVSMVGFSAMMTLNILGRVYIQGVSKTMRRSFCLISLATNMLEGWDIFNLNGGIHRSVLSTKSFLYDISEPGYKQIKKINLV